MAASFINSKDINTKADILTDIAVTAIKSADKEMARKATKLVIQKTEVAFKVAIKEFYTDPKFSIVENGYERQESMYNLLVTEERTVDDMIQPWYGFDDARMSDFDTGRKESGHRIDHENNGLYDQVFVKGWHGGADKVAPGKVSYPFQAHPSPGVPYYRRPMGSYKYWGERAAILKPSPQARFESYQMNAIKSAEPMLQKMYSQLVRDAVEREVRKAIRR